MSTYAPNALAIDCDEDGCKAPVGRACVRENGDSRAPHPSRVEKARAAEAAELDLWIQTDSGVAFDLAHPRAADVRTHDLAHSLARINRFGGHLRVSYSVAQHSVLCAALIWQRTRDRVATLAAALHDAHEAYTGDIKQPVKLYLERVAPGAVAALEQRIDHAIYSWAGLELVQAEADVRRLIKTADTELLFWERDRWMGAPPRPWIGEETTRRLTAADFGVDEMSALLDAWRSVDAENALRWHAQRHSGCQSSAGDRHWRHLLCRGQ